MQIELKLTPDLYNNLRVLVIAGAKSPQTDETAIFAAAQLLQMMMQAAEAAKAPKANGQQASDEGTGASAKE